MVPHEKGKSPAFQLYPADFLIDENVVIMSLEEKGAYIMLICFCWREGDIPDDIRRLSAMCGIDQKKMAKHWENIKPCFLPSQEKQGRLIHPRLEKEREKQTGYKEKCSNAGKKGAKKRWGEDRVPHGDPIATPSENDSEAIETPMAKNSSLTLISSLSLTSKENPPTPTSGGGEVVLEEKKPEQPKASPEVYGLAVYMAEKIKERVPHAKIPENFDKWANTLRLIQKQDTIPLSDIQATFEWANKDEFWHTNILSPDSLRRQFARLDAKRRAEGLKGKAEVKDTRPYALRLLDFKMIRNRFNHETIRTSLITAQPDCKTYGDKGAFIIKATGEIFGAESWEGVAGSGVQ